ncbi:MAG: hypothetical protein JNK35_07470 [Phycisphaerae bacterium]|nr:hypothetical protein [Phycisphaerae bacterium]
MTTPPGASGAAADHDSRASRLFWAAWATLAAFGTYFCMYAFRKPFTASTYADTAFAGIDFKTILVVAQVVGYTLSKFIGIRVIAEMNPARRAAALLALIAIAEAALLLFAILPRPWNAVGLFLNGLPLGMVFGLVMGFLEGRRLTEALAAGLCAAFVVADGAVKSVGAWLLQAGIPEDWMPAVAGALFLPPIALGAWMLQRIPPPSARDIAARARRDQMSRHDRRDAIGRHLAGLLLITAMYLMLTVVRSIRADFAPEIWKGLGAPAAPATFSLSEILVAAGVLLVLACTVFIRDNRRAFFAALFTCAVGFAVLAAALLGHRAGALGPFPVMVLIGLGMYLPYIAVQTTIFERMLAMTRDRGNIGFFIYFADAFGYLGYVAVLLGKGALSSSADIFNLFIAVCWGAFALSVLCLIGAWIHFARANRPAHANPNPSPASADSTVRPTLGSEHADHAHRLQPVIHRSAAPSNVHR